MKIKSTGKKKANELKQHNHLRFKTAKASGVPLGKRNFLSSLCVPVPDSQVDELCPGGERGEIAQHGRLFLMKTCSSFIFNAAEVISFSPGSIQSRTSLGEHFCLPKFHFSHATFYRKLD